jgi:hypothetical protein
LVAQPTEKLRLLEDSVLRRIFGLLGPEVTRGCRKLHGEELHNLYSSTNIITTKSSSVE